MSKPTVLILGKLPPPYMGPAIATEILLNSSLRNNYHLLHLNTKVNEDLGNLGKWSFKKVSTSFGLYSRMRKMLATQKPELVLIPFSQDTMPFLKDSVFIFLSKLYKKKTVLHLRGSNLLGWLSKSSALTRWYVKKVIAMSDGVIVLGENLRSLFNGILPQEKIFVVPNGADFLFPPRTEQTFTILYFANLIRSKGIEDVLAATKLLVEKGETNFRVVVAGAWRNSELEKECRAMVSAWQLPIEFHAPASGEKKFSFFSNADVFVFTPRAPEGHPWVIVEAMAAGLPIIATDRGAIAESVRHGENGYIVPVESPEEISAALSKLMKDESLRHQMAKQSRAFYEKGFTEQKMVERLDAAFQQVLRAL